LKNENPKITTQEHRKMLLQDQVTKHLLLFKIKKVSKHRGTPSRTPVAIISLAFLAFLALVALSIPVLTHSLPLPQAAKVISPTVSHFSQRPNLPLIPPSPPQEQPQSIQPFPTTMPAQIATLQAHNRFFYQGNPSLPQVALTFDDGPNPGYTEQILAILKKYQVKATFFDVGRLVALYPELAREEVNDGHMIANHSWSHPDMPLLSLNDMKTQLKDTSDIIQKVTGVRPTFMRPPYGDMNANVLTAINYFGLTGVIWNDEAKDWQLPGAGIIAARIVNQANKGTIILLHDGGGNRAQTVAALPTIIEQLLARHYQFVTMAQMAAYNLLKMDSRPQPNTTPTLTPTPTKSREAEQETGWP
jgi:peptidoglycan-N-acetylglucosamine deacetylase